jgi:hypothetical protein
MKCVPIAFTQVRQNDTINEIIAKLLFAIPETLAKKQLFICGNCKLNPLIYDSVIKGKPKVCSHCGCVIDWVGIKSVLINKCPQCPRIYTLFNTVCEDHIPVVRLEQVEVPI